MADTRIQLEAEQWTRDSWLPQHFGKQFHQRRYKLTSGGELLGALGNVSEAGR